MKQKKFISILCAVTIILCTLFLNGTPFNAVFSSNKVTAENADAAAVSPEVTTIDFEDSSETYIYSPSNTKRITVSEESGNSFVKINALEFNTYYFRLGNQLKKDGKYKVTYDYRITGSASLKAGSAFTFMILPETADASDFNPGSATFENSNALYAVGSIETKTTSGWESGEFTFDCDAGVVSEERCYLGFGFAKYWDDGVVLLDNIRLEYTAGVSYKYSTFDFENSENPGIFNYENTYSPVTVEQSGKNHYLLMNVGEYSSNYFTLDYKLKPNTTYKMFFDYNITEASLSQDTDFNFYSYSKEYDHTFFESYNENYAIKKAAYGLAQLPREATDGWQQYTLTFTTTSSNVTKENCWLGFGFCKYWNTGKVMFDNISVIALTEEEATLPVVNGNFEAEKAFWVDPDGIASPDADAFTGDVALRLKDGYYSSVYQGFIPQKNSNYEISFWYKGKTSGLINWSISHDKVSFLTDYSLSRGFLTDTTEWKQVKTVISAAEYGNIYISFQTAYGDDLLIDDLTVVPTTEKAVPVATAQAPHIMNSYDTTRFDGRHSDPALYICEQKDNLITDCSFEKGNGNWNQPMLYGSGTVSVADYDNARTGDKVLKFEAHDLTGGAWAMFYVDVEPETEYYFASMALGEKWSDTNTCDLQFGVIDAETGKFISKSDIRGRSDTKQLQPCFDGGWHSQRTAFYSGSTTRVGIGFYAANSTAYFDDMYLFKPADSIDYPSPERSVKKVSVTNDKPTEIGSLKEDNLFKNADLSDASDTFWSSAEGFYNGLSIADTGSTKGKALSYNAVTCGSGYAKQSYCYKWIDVKPNTEYIFSADYCIMTAGGGWFGLVTANKYLPEVICKSSFGDKDGFNADRPWHTVSLTFNTGGYTKIGFALCDGGGAAYIDNLCLVEASNAIVRDESTTFPQKITSNTLKFPNRILANMTLGTPVKEVLQAMDNSQYLRVFKNGSQITDLSSVIATGTEICLMDGATVVDRITMAVCSDVTGDGKCTGADIEKLLKFLSKKYELTSLEKIAADIDKNSTVDINDVALLCEQKVSD